MGLTSLSVWLMLKEGPPIKQGTRPSDFIHLRSVNRSTTNQPTITMKYAFFLVFVGVATAQLQNDPQPNSFDQPQPQTSFDRPQFNNQPQSTFGQNQPFRNTFNNQPQSTFGQNQPFRNTFNNQPQPAAFKPTPRPATVFNNQNNLNNPTRYTNQNQNNRNEAATTIVKQYYDDQGDGSYSWGFQSSDGSERQERIYFKNGGELGQILVKEGFYSYYDYDGRLIKVTYRADENGFQISEDNRLVVA